MRSLIVFTLLSSTILLASEPSVFGAGDLTNPNPYGLTHEEKLFLENKKEIQGIVRKNNVQNAKVESVTERLDGMQAIIEGLGQSVNDQRIALKKVETSVLDQNHSEVINILRKQSDANSENIIQLKTLLEELSKSVDSINASFVTKEEFGALINQLKITLPSSASSVSTSKKVDNTTLEKESKKLFDQKKYDEAQSSFEMMVQKKYKVPEANFWIAETLFERKKYKDAIQYYKQSASGNDKAAYLPTLLLHTGVAMEKTGDATSAKAFYGATISKFSTTGAAQEAKERLSKLK
ncbi:MAG: tetratricopeptide repeat protein [Sulfurimonas sp.]|jgi:TolA-binding protein